MNCAVFVQLYEVSCLSNALEYVMNLFVKHVYVVKCVGVPIRLIMLVFLHHKTLSSHAKARSSKFCLSYCTFTVGQLTKHNAVYRLLLKLCGLIAALWSSCELMVISKAVVISVCTGGLFLKL